MCQAEGENATLHVAHDISASAGPGDAVRADLSRFSDCGPYPVSQIGKTNRYERDERFGSSLSVRLAAAAVAAAIAVVTAAVATAVKAAATAAQQDQNEDNDPGASTVVTHIVFPL